MYKAISYVFKYTYKVVLYSLRFQEIISNCGDEFILHGISMDHQ